MSSASLARRAPQSGRVGSAAARRDRAAAAPAATASDAMSALFAGAKEVKAADSQIWASTSKYYGETLQTSDDLLTSACLTPNAPPRIVRNILRDVPDEVKAKYYGCGSPFPLELQGSGASVLDLGSGSGRDCYVVSALIGEKGDVTGVDMTDEQLAVANKYSADWAASVGYDNVRFVKGQIEDIKGAGVAPGSIDVIISNCVINLSPDKPAVLQGAYDALSEGGEFHFSDVYCDRRLPIEQREHEILRGECLGGAMYIEDFKRLCAATGFTDPRVLSGHEIEVKDEKLKALVGEAKFYSITYRLFKLPGMLETLCEDYGQFAVYKGTIPGSENAYVLDDHHRIEKKKPFLVCGNTAAMLGENGTSWLSPHFEIHGDRSVHYGLFDCGPSPVPAAAAAAPAAGGSCC